jgi:hypothetical protein
MKISKAQLVQIIKEEAANFKKELSLKNELAQIERQLNEVHTTGKLGVKTDTAGHQHNVVFDKVTSSAGVSDTIKEESDMDEMEELMAAIKTIAKACGLSGTIELEGEMGDEEGEEEEVETDVIEPGDEEGEGEEGEEGEDEEGEDEEGEYEEESEEEGEGAEEESFTLAKEEGAENEEALEEENENAEESKTLSEGIERKRMMQLAGLK